MHTRPRVWCDVRKRATVSITIFGGSVTAGCGAEAPSKRCDVRWSWGRHMQDRLREMLLHAGADWKVEVRAWGKNAVESSYFSQCTRSRFQLSGNTSIVLIELESAYQANGERGLLTLRGLVARIRRAAPRAAIGFVGWPSMYGNPKEMEAAMFNNTALDVALTTPLLRAAEEGGFGRAAFYGDSVHPNLAGHVVVGRAVAYMLARGLLGSESCDHAAHSERTAAAQWKHEHAAASAPVDDQHEVEVCIGNADELPIVQPVDGWALRDEGQHKGVKKLGYVSTTVGASMVIGPLLPSIRCGLLDVSFGYLQSWRPDMGALRISCIGCSCSSIPGAWASGAYPYPRIETWSYGQPVSVKEFQKSGAAIANASLTMSTRFAMLKSEASCFLNVTHVKGTSKFRPVPAGVRNATPPSRVRVDSIGFELATCLMNCHFTHYPSHKKIAVKGRECARGADRGESGHFAPACFSNGSGTCAVALKKEQQQLADPAEEV